MVNLTKLHRAGGLAALRDEMARQYPDMIARIKVAPDAAPASLLGKAMVGAVCAGDQDNALRIAGRLMPGLPALGPLRLSPLGTLADYCGARGHRYEEVLPPARVRLAPTTSYSLPYSYETTPAWFASLPQAQFIPGWDFVLGEDGTILTDSGYMPPHPATRAFITFYVRAVDSLIHYAPAEERFVDEEVLFLSAPENNIGHWMIDFLPRLKGLALLAGRKVKLAVPADLPPRCIAMLRAFGVADEDILACAPGVRHRFRMCHIYKPGIAEPPNPVHVKFVREGLTRGMPLRITPGKRVFLSRASVGTRRIANQAEVDALLAREGFIAADLAHLDFAGQKELLGDAEVILGPFGSNLFGMYLAPGNCTLMMLINAALEDSIFAHTAAILGLRHQFVLCATTPESAAIRNKERDVIVNCEALAAQISLAGA